MKNLIIKYKFIILIAAIALVIIIGGIFLSKNKSEGDQGLTPGSTDNQEAAKKDEYQYTPPQYSQLPAEEELDPQKVNNSVAAKKKLISNLPIYIPDFKISNGMKTTLNVYDLPGDPNYVIHVEIYGVNYHEQNPDRAQNPNVVAFIESFNEIKKQLTNRGVDLSQIYFVFDSRDYIYETAKLWIDTFKLL